MIRQQVDSFYIAGRCGHFGHAIDVLPVIGYPGNNREAGLNLAALGRRLEISQDHFIGNTGEFFVGSRVHELEVKKDPVNLFKGNPKRMGRRMTACIQNRVDVTPAADIQQGKQEFRLHQRFAAGKGHAAAGIVIKNNIPFHCGHHLGNRHRLAKRFRLFPGAFIRRADLRCHVHPFRVVAPPAIERAPFKENSRADTGTVMDGISFNSEYYSTVGVQSHSLPRCCQPLREG